MNINSSQLHFLLMHQSIPSANIPRAMPRNFFEVVKGPFRGQNFSPVSGERFKRSSKPCLLIMSKFRSSTENQTLTVDLGVSPITLLVMPSTDI